VRTSVVKSIKIHGTSEASIAQIGDNVKTETEAKVLALHRQIPVFLGREGGFAHYPIFSKPLPQPIVDEPMIMNIVNESPWIEANRIHILGISVAAVFQVGSNHCIETQARVKHIRQFIE
jgi:spore germination protein PE